VRATKYSVFWKYRFRTYFLEDWLCVPKWRKYATRVLSNVQLRATSGYYYITKYLDMKAVVLVIMSH
jgi:hypothetical protein